MIAIDKRLKTIAKFINKDSFVLDVGADHGYLSIYLIESGIAKKVTATDVKKMPLESAEKNIIEHNLTDRINTLLTDGLKGINLTEVTDIVVAGMGGILISEILSEKHPLQDKNLVLQPMTQAPFLRKWLCKNGYHIVSEAPVFVGDKGYCVINAVYDGKIRNSDKLFELIGKIPFSKEEETQKYLDYIKAKLQKKIDGLKKSKSDSEKLAEALSLVDKIPSKR